MKDRMGKVSESPPPYDQEAYLTESSRTSQDLSRHQNNSRYTPVQYNLAGQDPLEFYEALIDASNHPSEIFCRMADALFFYMDRHCSQFCGTQHIEPAKVAWLGVALGQDMEVSMAVQQHLPALYDAASIPYTYNHTRIPVLDRRGHLHFCVFEVRADPEYARQKWNKILNILKLHDPLTDLPFPTPVPCSAFPAVPHPVLNQVYADGQIKTPLQASPQILNSSPTQNRRGSIGNDTPHSSLTAQVQQAVPIARRAAFQSMQQHDSSQRIKAAKDGFMQLGSSQNFQEPSFGLEGMAEEGYGGRYSGPRKPATAHVPWQTAPIARLVASQAVERFEKPQTPAAERRLKVLEIPQKTFDTQPAPNLECRVSQEEIDKGRYRGLHKSPTLQVQEAVSTARRAALQIVQERLRKIQAPKRGTN